MNRHRLLSWSGALLGLWAGQDVRARTRASRTDWLLRTGRTAFAVGLMLVAIGSGAKATENVLFMPPDLTEPGETKHMNVIDGETAVVWGNTTFPNGSAFTIDFGDGSPVLNGTVMDRSYVFTTHVYTAAVNQTVYTASFTVNGETETVLVKVWVTGQASSEDLRGVSKFTAIRDGLRSLYFNQVNRAANFGSPTTSWASGATFGLVQQTSATSLAVLAVQNHDHLVTNDPTKDVYQSVVQRGLNFLFDNLQVVTLTDEPAGDPCVGVPNDGDRCDGLGQTANRGGYSTSIAAFAPAAAVARGAGARTVEPGLGAANGGFVVGRTYSEILQRQVNAIAWGQADSPVLSRGGWRYFVDNADSDGSAIAWAVLALLDAQVAGATIPAFVATELANVIAQTSCGTPPLSNGLAYQSCVFDGNVLRTGAALQALFFMGVPKGDPLVVEAVNYINTAWNSIHPNGESHACPNPSGLGPGSPSGSGNNKGCIYAMYQVFKGLQLYGVDTLTNAQPLPPDAPPGASNWAREYENYLGANQQTNGTTPQTPSSPAGGEWEAPQVHWSCCESGPDVRDMTTALALLIQAAGVFTLCDQLILEPEEATNQLSQAEDEHTVTATCLSATGDPIAGNRVDFLVLSGPNQGQTAQETTGPDGKATFTYTSAQPCSAGEGTDDIRATSTVESNVVTKNWTCQHPCSELTLAPEEATNQLPDDSEHTVTATCLSPSGDPVPSQLVTFAVTSGPNAGVMCEDITDQNGQATCTYSSKLCDVIGEQGTDTIQASISSLDPGIASKTWICNRPPSCEDSVPKPGTLWPPNHKLRRVSIRGVTDPDSDDVVNITVTGVRQDEPVNARGDGNTCPDAEILGAIAKLRSERSGRGDGRVYHVGFTASDGHGGECSGEVQVCVPHDQSGAGCVDQGPLADSTVCGSAGKGAGARGPGR